MAARPEERATTMRVPIGQLVRAARYGHEDPAFRLQARVARAAGLPVRRVWEIESRRYMPTEAEVAALCEVLPLLPVLLRAGARRPAPRPIDVAARL